jgi:hypothetical protein
VWSLSNDQNIAAMEAAVPTASKVLIYGDTLQAYGALRRVISAGAALTSVALVTPPKANGADTCFGDANIDALVKTQLTQLGVVLYDGFTLTRVEGNTEGCLASAVFESDGKAQEITCDVLGCFADPNTDLSVAKALNDNALVYDGRLVINALFQSNDPAVMAAGSVTKFSRRYGHQKPVRCYNSREVGIQLGRTVVDLAMFDGANLDADTLPTFSQAKAKGCVLPGPGAGLHFFSAAAPAGDKIRGAGTEGRALVTEATARDGSPQYCCVYVDKFDVIESITYLGTECLEWSNLMRVVGMPQGYLNRLITHFDEGLVPSLPDWFRQPWAMAMYHDRFPELVQALKAEMQGQSDASAIVQQLSEWAEARDKSQFTVDALTELRKPLVSKLATESRRMARDVTTEFVRNNARMLSMIMEKE